MASLKEYLKKYTNNNDEQKKKKRKKKAKPENTGVLVVDEDPVWQKPVKLLEEEEDSADEEKPQINEDIEVKRMKRLEQLKARRPYGAISEDGSGWVSLTIKPENQDIDISPPRTRRRNDTPSPRPDDQPPIPKDADLSPPRKCSTKMKASNSSSPPRTRRRNDTLFPGPDDQPFIQEDADLSPPRKRSTQMQVSDSSGGRKARHDTSSSEPSDSERKVSRDLSPPRRKQRHNNSPSPEPGRSSYSMLKDSDISPPRRVSRDSSHRNDSSTADLSPPRKLKKEQSDGRFDSRRSTPSVYELSSPRRRKGSPPFVNRPRTGLVSGREVKDEIDRNKKEDLMRFRKMDPSVSGRDAEAVYRDKMTGQRMSKEEYLELQEKKQKKDKPKEIKVEWGKGLAQRREADAKREEMEAEKDRPFARTKDDAALDKQQREEQRFGDPMANYIKKKNPELFLPNLGDNERMKESGFIVPQDIPNHSWLRRGFEAAPNRYKIKPGRHWDGVDRSTGYEKELFKRTSEKKATEQEAYLWSVSDM